MKKTNQQLIDRAKHVQETVKKSPRTDVAVAKLTRELFLSERTIYNDLKRKVY